MVACFSAECQCRYEARHEVLFLGLGTKRMKIGKSRIKIKEGVEVLILISQWPRISALQFLHQLDPRHGPNAHRAGIEQRLRQHRIADVSGGFYAKFFAHGCAK